MKMDKGTFILYMVVIILLSLTLYFYKTNQPKPLQNVVCDTSYGVQYFEHKGVLTLRVNNEGKPIKCYE